MAKLTTEGFIKKALSPKEELQTVLVGGGVNKRKKSKTKEIIAEQFKIFLLITKLLDVKTEDLLKIERIIRIEREITYVYQ